MPHDASDEYFRNREAQERAAADATTDDVARRVHLDLARRYAAMSDAPVAGPFPA